MTVCVVGHYMPWPTMKCNDRPKNIEFNFKREFIGISLLGLRAARENPLNRRAVDQSTFLRSFFC